MQGGILRGRAGAPREEEQDTIAHRQATAASTTTTKNNSRPTPLRRDRLIPGNN